MNRRVKDTTIVNIYAHSSVCMNTTSISRNEIRRRRVRECVPGDMLKRDTEVPHGRMQTISVIFSIVVGVSLAQCWEYSAGREGVIHLQWPPVNNELIITGFLHIWRKRSGGDLTRRAAGSPSPSSGWGGCGWALRRHGPSVDSRR